MKQYLTLLLAAVALTAAGCGDDGAVIPDDALRVFITSSTYSGDLGGVAGADAKCQLAADAEALGGTWRAWLSTSTEDAFARIAGDGPWYQLDGTLTFNNHANLATTPQAEIKVMEDAEYLFGEPPKDDGNGGGDGLTGVTVNWTGVFDVWSGTAAGGVAASDTCSDWQSELHTGLLGDPAATGSEWTAWRQEACDASDGHLYCFEQ